MIRNPAVDDGEADKPLCSAEDDAKSDTRPWKQSVLLAQEKRQPILREDVICCLNLNCA